MVWKTFTFTETIFFNYLKKYIIKFLWYSAIEMMWIILEKFEERKKRSFYFQRSHFTLTLKFAQECNKTWFINKVN